MSILDKVVENIKTQHLLPRPRWHFLLKNSVLWACALVSTMLGGIALALMVFFYIDHDAVARVQLNDTLFEDLLEIIPLFWLGSLVALTVLSRYAVKYTTFGYRYSTARVVAFALIGSALIALMLHITEVGERMQDFLVERAPQVIMGSQSAGPEKGFLEGAVQRLLSSDECELVDTSGKMWVVDLGPLDESERALLRPGVRVIMRGSLEDSATFRAARLQVLK